MERRTRFDGPFWAALIAGILLVGSFGCIGLAAAAQSASVLDAPVLAVGDAPPMIGVAGIHRSAAAAPALLR